MKTQKNNLPRLLLAVATSAALLISGNAFASGYGYGDHDDHHGKGHKSAMQMAEKIANRLEDVLDLSNAQEDKIAAILAKSIEKRQQQLKSKHGDIQQLWKKSTLSVEEIERVLREKHGDHEQHKAEMRETHIALVAETMAQVHAVLTPEQRSIAAQRVEHMLLQGGRYGKHKRHSNHY